MSNDQFALSIGQAQQLEFALNRNGWTSADVHKLCEGETLGRVKSFLDDPDGHFSQEVVAAFQRHGISSDLLERLINPYWQLENRSSGLAELELFHTAQSSERWLVQVMDDIRGILHGVLVTISEDDLQQLEEAAKREAMLESENKNLRKAVAHFHRPVTEVFSEENCRSNPQNWAGRNLMSVRTRVLQMFENNNIGTVGDLVRVHESEILSTYGMGRKSLDLIKAVLADIGLHLGMEVPDQA